jgi:hypothetical protein
MSERGKDILIAVLGFFVAETMVIGIAYLIYLFLENAG